MKRLYFIVFITILFILHSIHGQWNIEEDLRRLSSASDSTDSIISSTTIFNLSTLEIYYDPPAGYTSPTALTVFAWSNLDNVKIYYEIGANPTLNSSYASSTAPYIQVNTPTKGGRNRTLVMIGVWTDSDGRNFRSQQHAVKYYVESIARPYSYGYLIPGVESSGYFVQVKLEVKATARAQAATTQEFSDFYTNLGIGTYSSQIQALHLPTIDSDLQGFEGGFPYNTSEGVHYGLLIPYHNGEKYFGKVVRVRLYNLTASACIRSYAIEYIDSKGRWRVNGTDTPQDACVHVLDLTSIHSEAKGFRKGFMNYPYGYLSAGETQLLVRLDLENLSLNTTRVIDLSKIDKTLGGYSGGFADGDWACFNPFRTYMGAVGGIRSSLAVDKHNFIPYYSSIMFCANHSAWQLPSNVSAPSNGSYRTIDFSPIRQTLRGFSDAIRVGRYAYLIPFMAADNTFSSLLVRINLGKVNIVNAVDAAMAKAGNVRSIVNIVDLSQVNTSLAGFSSAFTSGNYLLLVPFRNSYQASNGQRGHGFLTRLDMNKFSLSGIEYMDATVTTRNQIPSFYDTQLRGFSYGFASGLYGFMVPFFNADFSGKMARFYGYGNLSSNLQELDLTVDRTRSGVYKGFRGGFASLWQGLDS